MSNYCPSISSRISRLFYFLCVLTTLSACVTTVSGGMGVKLDREQAVKDTLLLARTYAHQKNWQAAKRHLKRAIELDDSDAGIYELMGVVFQNTGELELAEQYFKRSIKLDSSALPARNNYAVYLYQQGRYSEAIEHLEIVVADSLYEQRGNAFANLGRCYLQLSELQNARNAFRRAFLMNRNDYYLMLELAGVYYRLEDYSSSQRYYDGYRANAKQQSSKALWLGIRLADKFDNLNSMSSYSMALKNRFPTSNEYVEYIKAFQQ